MVISDVVAAGMIIIGVLEPVNNQRKHGKTILNLCWVKTLFSHAHFLRDIHVIVEHNYNVLLQCDTPNTFVHDFFCNLHTPANYKYMNILIRHFSGIRLCF